MSTCADCGLAESLFKSLMAFLRSSREPDFTVLKRLVIDSAETAGVDPMRFFIQVEVDIHVILPVCFFGVHVFHVFTLCQDAVLLHSY